MAKVGQDTPIYRVGLTRTDGESREGREDPVSMGLTIGHTISRREFVEK